MARINSYERDSDIENDDVILGTDGSGGATVTFTLGGIKGFYQNTFGENLMVAENDTGAATAGVPVNGAYRTMAGVLRIRVS